MPTTAPVFFPQDNPEAELPYRKAIVRYEDIDFFAALGGVRSEAELKKPEPEKSEPEKKSKKVEKKDESKS